MRFLCYTLVTLAVSLGMYANDVGWVTMDARDARSYNFVATILLVALLASWIRDLFDFRDGSWKQ